MEKNKQTIKKAVDFLIKYDDFAQKRTIRPVTPYPGSPLYYDAIKMGLLDKDNPAEDFYERKHLNSDLICCNFTELSDEEYYECLRWANTTLMTNYFNRQKTSTLTQIDHLYREKDVTFRGFRHSGGAGPTGPTSENYQAKTKKRAIAIEGKEVMDGMTNWEGSQVDDGERFAEGSIGENGNKNLSSFDSYLKKKEIRALARKEAKKKTQNIAPQS